MDCEFRQQLVIDGAVFYKCRAAGDALQVAEEGELEAICKMCKIPCENTRKPCLYLVPLLRFKDGNWEAIFPCSWFFLSQNQRRH